MKLNLLEARWARSLKIYLLRIYHIQDGKICIILPVFALLKA